VRGDGATLCWGANYLGQLGNGGHTGGYTPVPANLVPEAVSVSAGEQHSCAVLSNGRVYCWGFNTGGQIGNGQEPKSLLPIPVTGSPFCERLYLGSCAIRSEPPANRPRMHEIQSRRATLGRRDR
jgi:alpha-tubulin suppressor-like RCC1 family protein